MRTLNPFCQALLTSRLRFVDSPEGGEGGGGNDDPPEGSEDKGDQNKGGDEDPPKGWKMEELPADAQAYIKKLRGENATSRTEAKTKAAKEAVEARNLELAKALGLVEGDDKKLTPEQVDAKLREAGEKQAKAENTAKIKDIELAVYRNASKNGADPDALLDSRSFLEKVAKLDPGAGDFAEKVAKAVKDAVEANPKLKSQAGGGSSSVDHGAGGSGEQGERKNVGLAGAVGGHYGTT